MERCGEDAQKVTSWTTQSGSTFVECSRHGKTIFQPLCVYSSGILTQLDANSVRRKALFSLPHAHQALLQSLDVDIPGPHGSASHSFRAKLAEMDDRVRRNADVLEQVSIFCQSFLGLLDGNNDEEAPEDTQEAARPIQRISDGDQDRVRTAIRQMVRDWSVDGAEERAAVYAPLLEAVAGRFPNHRSDRRVLVPGAGLGRLAFEFARLGFSTQGNEFSYYMLIPAHFVLNNTARVGEHTLYPYVHSASNWRTTHDMLRGVAVPDVLPSSLSPEIDFSMVAGEVCPVIDYTHAVCRGICAIRRTWHLGRSGYVLLHGYCPQRAAVSRSH